MVRKNRNQNHIGFGWIERHCSLPLCLAFFPAYFIVLWSSPNFLGGGGMMYLQKKVHWYGLKNNLNLIKTFFVLSDQVQRDLFENSFCVFVDEKGRDAKYWDQSSWHFISFSGNLYAIYYARVLVFTGVYFHLRDEIEYGLPIMDMCFLLLLLHHF